MFLGGNTVKSKVNIIDSGKCAYLELCGKIMGPGIDFIQYKKKGGESAKLTIHIDDLDGFEFLPDDYLAKLDD